MPSTILIRQWARLQLAASGYPDPDTRYQSTEDGFHGGSTALRFNHITEGLVKATACDRPETSLSLAVQPSSACLHTARDDKVKGCVHTL